MIICPTTHNDWDWQVTFETYYSTGTPTTGGTTQSVRAILDSVTRLFEGIEEPDRSFCFSYAEVGFLRRYLNEFPEKALAFRKALKRFSLLGGGITSPDNQSSHGEVFIRNYLTGHQFLKSVGLIDHVFPVAWLPDDFGHDPQLPVLIAAMGMKAIGLSRIPGSPQPTLCPAQQPANNDVRANGLTFIWPANDGSSVLTHFMPRTYYGITNYSLTDTATAMQDFLRDNNDQAIDPKRYAVWPGNTVFATQGGDWQFPKSPDDGGNSFGEYDWVDAINATVTSGDITVTSRLGTFEDYYNALRATPEDITQFTLYAENYWTGCFASRPQLKIDHYNAAQSLMGAEVLESILALYGGTTRQNKTDLAAAIAAGWHLLVPTTHHDYVTGTSQDAIYEVSPVPPNQVWDSAGQLPMSRRAAELATDALNLGMTQLAAAANAVPLELSEIPVVVFNQLGRGLPDTALVEMDDPSGGQMRYAVRVDLEPQPVQRSSDGKLLFQVSGMASMAYKVVYLMPLGPAQPLEAIEQAEGDFAFTNDNVVNLVLSQDNGWAISELTIGGNSYVQPNGPFANRIGVWADSGNLYQFGMEFMNDCTEGTFDFDSYLTGETGRQVEFGPIRWRFIGDLKDDASKNTYTTQYDLIRGETQVRITTTGASPASAGSATGAAVLTSFPMQTPAGETAGIMEYGTSYYWENRNPQQSWAGLTFRATHDFAQLATGTIDQYGNASPVDAVAAVYHNGIPAWTIDGSALLGCLFRNAPGTQRGANGTDADPHVQKYTLDVEARLAVTGYPLRTALYTQTPLHAVPVNMNVVETGPVAAQLASVEQSDALIRVAKMNPPYNGGQDLILRIQRSGMVPKQLDVDLALLTNRGYGVPSIVTALETVPETQTAVTLNGTVASFDADRALWTMLVPILAPGNAE
jgi:alpha-mannosidase